MEIQFQLRHLALPLGFTELAVRRIRFGLARFAPRIRRVRVRLEDLNAMRGGIDKRCVVEALLRPNGAVVVEVLDAELESAVGRAVDRMARRISDAVQRRRELRRHNGRTDVTTPAYRGPPT